MLLAVEICFGVPEDCAVSEQKVTLSTSKIFSRQHIHFAISITSSVVLITIPKVTARPLIPEPFLIHWHLKSIQIIKEAINRLLIINALQIRAITGENRSKRPPTNLLILPSIRTQ